MNEVEKEKETEEIGKMIEELKKQGYRVSKPKPKEKKEFEPFEAIHLEFGSPSKVIVVKETPKFAVVKFENSNQEFKIPKKEIYEFNQEIFNIYDDAKKKERELNKEIEKIRDEMWEKIDSLKKPKYRD